MRRSNLDSRAIDTDDDVPEPLPQLATKLRTCPGAADMELDGKHIVSIPKLGLSHHFTRNLPQRIDTTSGEYELRSLLVVAVLAHSWGVLCRTMCP